MADYSLVLIGYTRPWQEDIRFIEALRRCNEVKENFIPLAGSLTAAKRKRLERTIREKK